MHLSIPKLSEHMGPIVQGYRRDNRYSQEDFSELLHITPRSLSALENGRSFCNSVTLLRFLDFLGPEEQHELIHELVAIMDTFFEQHSDCA